MNIINLKSFGVSEMNANELFKIEGGWVIPFVVGAIVGGMIYDAWKAGVKNHFQTMMDTGGDAFIRGGR